MAYKSTVKKVVDSFLKRNRYYLCLNMQLGKSKTLSWYRQIQSLNMYLYTTLRGYDR